MIFSSYLIHSWARTVVLTALLCAASQAQTLVADINTAPTAPGSSPWSSVTVGTDAFFVASDARGAELWKTDGRASGTAFVEDIRLVARRSRIRVT